MRQLTLTVFLLCALCAPLAADEFEDLVASARQGDSIDQHDVGIAYYHGNGVTQDYKQAYIWLSLSAAGGLDDAAENRDKAAGKLTPEQLQEADAEIRSLSQQIGKSPP